MEDVQDVVVEDVEDTVEEPVVEVTEEQVVDDPFIQVSLPASTWKTVLALLNTPVSIDYQGTQLEMAVRAYNQAFANMDYVNKLINADNKLDEAVNAWKSS